MPFDPGRVRAIVFDLDGTLVDTDDDYIRRPGVLSQLAYRY
jgi:phosphoglycolate phosphatase-like HAD superfamily hydrolase